MTVAARRHWNEALAIYFSLGAPETDQVRAPLAQPMSTPTVSHNPTAGRRRDRESAMPKTVLPGRQRASAKDVVICRTPLHRMRGAGVLTNGIAGLNWAVSTGPAIRPPV